MSPSPEIHDVVCASRLRRLPTEAQPPYNWQEFRRRARETSQPHWFRVQGWQTAAASALLVLVIGAAVWGWHGSRVPREALVSGQESTRVQQASAQSGASPASESDSRQIESWLHSLPHEPVLVRVGTRAAVAGLEDRIAQLDDLLSSERLEGAGADRLAPLQKERARLVGSLAQVRYAEVVASAVP